MKLPIHYEPVDRLTVIQNLVELFFFEKYLEIGCDTDSVFTKLDCRFKVGIDPQRGGNMRMTSDEYFSLTTETFDLIFIDGLHYYDQISRDFESSLRCLNPGGVILLHDLLPTQPSEVEVPIPKNLSWAWTGDVWRFSFDLMARSDIQFHLLNLPYGMGFVIKGQQIPKQFSTEPTWQWYSDNWNHLPIVSSIDTLSAKFRNLIT